MKRAGQIALVPFPFTDLNGSKLRPVLLLRKTSTHFDDWLVCMISSQLRQAEPGLDEILTAEDDDFGDTGLKASSVLRLGRLAVVDGAMFNGQIGAISGERLDRLLHRLAAWLTETPKPSG
ncbi:type II toxin-antitoxin system PemK/MazF family toxin [Azospirillum sp. TSO35-2]|uniref:type II toxin-antitoxin system PemK/MazF family toxin n=1 Tax=Azospirillum sp. TSO35-2 TaxID=716796 RepID=UPI000D614511|nr:type II toxin-antitoxin system PemK/MazF family toxin [Azospirillum sp. TSO35-2]PWC39051.1 PemK family protein [Azospirillum sp. TSO35-2]